MQHSDFSVFVKNAIYNRLFILAEFREALAGCTDSALGLEGISYQMILHLHPSSSAFLLTLFYLIWVEGIFPPILQLAHIVPIPKPGKDPSLANNQRPIALTCQVWKRVVNRLLLTLEKAQAFSSLQFGFCLDYDNLETSTNKMVLAVFFDLEKAYDYLESGGPSKTLLPRVERPAFRVRWWWLI